jgi:hypothetical protein
MYHNCDDFSQLSQNQEFLAGLISTLYPLEDMTPEELVSPAPLEIQPFAEAICNDKTKTYKSFLSVHPARKLLLDFLRDLICDSITSKQSVTLIEVVLLAVPENQTKRSQEFVTELLKTVLEHLLSADLFNEQHGQLPTQTQIQNLINLIDRLIDKLYDGLYRRDPRELFESLVKLQTNLKKKSNFGQDQIVNAINRILLYQLSRPCFSLPEQVNMLDVVHKIQKNKNLIFSNGINQDFYSCPTYCLLLITNDGEETEAARTRAWTCCGSYWKSRARASGSTTWTARRPSASRAKSRPSCPKSPAAYPT